MDEPGPLETEIRRRIAAAGPMPVAEYMALCLSHPEHGYYTTRDPLGASGDFITAPEISQMFGELIGLWMAAVWSQMGSPDNIRIIELGPGRGTLMKDAMRAVKVMPRFREALVLHLVEINPALRARQESALDPLSLPVFWHATLNDVPQGPAIVIANEFFDALPVNQAVKSSRGWHERQVGIDADGALAFTVATDPTPHLERLLPPALRDAPEGAMAEWRDATAGFDLGRRLKRDGGAALVIDYGHTDSAAGDTLQAVGQHAYADPLSAPGSIDITAHVDFAALTRAVEAMGADGYGPITQAELLRRLGIDSRAATLKSKATGAQIAEIEGAMARLTGDGRTGMGTLFKAAAYAHPALGAPPAFAPRGAQGQR